jgi:hypothetical protein
VRFGGGGRAKSLRSVVLGYAVDRFLGEERIDPGIEVKCDQFACGFRPGDHAASSSRRRSARRLSAQQIREQSAIGVPDLKSRS